MIYWRSVDSTGNFGDPREALVSLLPSSTHSTLVGGGELLGKPIEETHEVLATGRWWRITWQVHRGDSWSVGHIKERQQRHGEVKVINTPWILSLCYWKVMRHGQWGPLAQFMHMCICAHTHTHHTQLRYSHTLLPVCLHFLSMNFLKVILQGTGKARADNLEQVLCRSQEDKNAGCWEVCDYQPRVISWRMGAIPYQLSESPKESSIAEDRSLFVSDWISLGGLEQVYFLLGPQFSPL